MSSSYSDAEKESAKSAVIELPDREHHAVSHSKYHRVVPNTNLFDSEESAAQAMKDNRLNSQNSHGPHTSGNPKALTTLRLISSQLTMHPRALLLLHEEMNLHNVVSGGGTDAA